MDGGVETVPVTGVTLGAMNKLTTPVVAPTVVAALWPSAARVLSLGIVLTGAAFPFCQGIKRIKPDFTEPFQHVEAISVSTSQPELTTVG